MQFLGMTRCASTITPLFVAAAVVRLTLLRVKNSTVVKVNAYLSTHLCVNLIVHLYYSTARLKSD